MPARDAEYAAESPPHNSARLANMGTSQKHLNGTITSDIDIIDIRCDAIEMDLKVEITSMLKPGKGPRKLPTLLLYDEKGLQIFEKVGTYYICHIVETYNLRLHTWINII